MEKDFYTDEFEQLLKDTTEDFRMYPSRKVWHSIYNDLHPAKKWPSFAVCLLLITTILYVGIDNNNAINADADNIVLSTLSPTGSEGQKGLPSTISLQKEQVVYPSSHPQPLTVSYSPTDLSVNHEVIINRSIHVPTLAYKDPRSSDIFSATLIDVPYQRVVAELSTAARSGQFIPVIAEAHNPSRNEPVGTTGETVPATTVMTNEPTSTDDATAVLPGKTTDNASHELAAAAPTNLTNTKKSAPTDEKVWMDNYAFHNVRNGNKWKTKLSTLVYITPSVGYRVMNRNNSFEPVNALLIRSNATSVDADDAITQQAAMNLESGATAILDLSRKLRIKAGVQFNYTNYVSLAERLSHPTQTNILLNDLATDNTVLVPVSSTFGNKGGAHTMRLNNNTIQFSLPIGADYKIAGNDKIKWYVGATIQPTYVAGGNAYLVSSDYKNYVDMPSMLRTWNVNAGFESFVSYKTKGGSVINLGPQFRYQLQSTYSNRYTYTENLYNVGVKIGITRKF